MMEKRAFVTGATGFVGGALVKRLIADGWQVVALVREGSDSTGLQSLGATVVTGDICRPESLAGAMAGCEIVFHCAALTGVGHRLADFYRVIADGSRDLLQAAREQGVTRLVFVSSVAVYELDGAAVCDEGQPRLGSSIDPYARAKIQAEDACLDAHRRGDLAVCIVRPAFIYGPGDRQGGFLPEVVRMMAAGKFKLIGGGRSPLPLIYISDLAELLLRCGEAPQAAGEIYNACAADSPSWREVARTLSDALNIDMPGSVSEKLVLPAASAMETLVRLKCLRTLPLSKSAVMLLSRDVSFPADKATRELGFVPRVGFAEGIRQSLPMLSTLLAQPTTT